jgi:C4-dicarboxylate transporter DctQ subunit
MRAWLDEFEERAAGLILAVMVAIVVVEIAARPFHLQLGFLVELVPDLFVWTVMLAAAAAFHRGAHLSLTVLADRLTPVHARLLARFGSAVSFTLMLAIGVASLRIVAVSWSNAETTSLGIPQWLMSAALPVGCFLAAIRICEAAWRARPRT